MLLSFCFSHTFHRWLYNRHFKMWKFVKQECVSSVLSVCLQRVFCFFWLSGVSSIRRRTESIWILTRSFHNSDPLWHEAYISLSYNSHCRSTATSKWQQTGYVYQMYPANLNDKIINLLRLVDSLVRPQFEFIVLGPIPLQPTLPCLYYTTLYYSLFTVS